MEERQIQDRLNDVVTLTTKDHLDNIEKLYRTPDGITVRFGSQDVDTLHKLRVLGDRAFFVLGWSERLEEMQKYINNRKSTYALFCLDLLDKEWFWRETGERAALEDFEGLFKDFFGSKFTFRSFKRTLLGRQKPRIGDMNWVINWFVGERSDVYCEGEV